MKLVPADCAIVVVLLPIIVPSVDLLYVLDTPSAAPVPLDPVPDALDILAFAIPSTLDAKL